MPKPKFKPTHKKGRVSSGDVETQEAVKKAKREDDDKMEVIHQPHPSEKKEATKHTEDDEFDEDDLEDVRQVRTVALFIL